MSHDPRLERPCGTLRHLGNERMGPRGTLRSGRKVPKVALGAAEREPCQGFGGTSRENARGGGAISTDRAREGRSDQRSQRLKWPTLRSEALRRVVSDEAMHPDGVDRF